MRALTPSDWTGLAADLFTLFGGLILAADAVWAVQHFSDEQLRLKTIKSFANRVRLHTEDGQPLKNENDSHLASLRRLAGSAKWGAFALIAGYVLQLVTRLLEICTK
jgi:hypothetical protein